MISKRGLLEQASRHADSLSPLLSWYQVARRAVWRGLMEVRRDFSSADQVGNVLIFNIKGNRYRLIARVNYQTQRLFVKALLTHAEYDKKGWLRWA